MTITQVNKLNRNFMLTTWRNNKNNKTYVLTSIAFDATNSRNGCPVAIYKSTGMYVDIFVRDWDEFKEKFTEIK